MIASDGYGGLPREQDTFTARGLSRGAPESWTRLHGRCPLSWPMRSLTVVAVLTTAMYYAIEFARNGFDFLSLSKGGKFEDAHQPKVGQAVYPYTGRSGYECMPTVMSDERGPFGRNVPLVEIIKRSVTEAGFDTPLIATGGIGTFEEAEEILKRGQADIVGMARQALADPDWFVKVKLGRGAEVRRCTYTNYCEALDQAHRPVTCKLWDRVDLEEPGIATVDEGRRRLEPPEWKPD